MQVTSSEARALVWDPLWEDEPDPWWLLGRAGQVFARNRAAAAAPAPPELPAAAWAALDDAGVWRGELGGRPGVACASEGLACVALPTAGPARGSPLRQALEAAASAMIGVEHGRIVYRSAGARRWAGRELLGETPRAALPPSLRGVLAGHGPPPEADPDSSASLRRLSWRRVQLGSGADVPTLLVGIDAAPAPSPGSGEGRRGEGGPLASARLSAIGEMAAGVAHELNQPLNVITGYIELLQDGGGSRDDVSRALEVMARAAERMATLVSHLRDYTRAGLETLRPVDLREVLRHADELSSRAAPAPVPLSWAPPSEPYYVLGDPGRLEQLFINLIANARQATVGNNGRRVELRLFPTEAPSGAAGARRGAVAIEVLDQGPGVPVGLRDRIFEPFFTTRGREGTGLGLSICDRIAREHQGRVEVDDAPGGGALFRVLLPRYAPI